MAAAMDKAKDKIVPGGVPFKGQKYRDIKRALQTEGKLFVDPEFNPDDTALAYDISPYIDVEWKRPGQLVEEPRLFAEGGPKCTSVNQGIMKDSWFVAACSILATKKSLMGKVVPDQKEQEWNQERPELYCGIFHFSFWQFGQWIDVVVDDLLPTQNGQLIFCKSRHENEFWSALLEKAYAKLYGCYEALCGGALSDTFMDLTGGVPDLLDLTTRDLITSAGARGALFEEMKKCYDANAFMAAVINVPQNAEAESEQPLECGLIKARYYAVTMVARLDLDGGLTKAEKAVRQPDKVLMIRLRNPWTQKEWNGPWSDGAREWESISEQQRTQLDLKFEDEGEFWMAFDDFCEYYNEVIICHQMNTSFFSTQTRYYEKCFQGSWVVSHVKGHLSNRAGGAISYPRTYWQNPQYTFDIAENFTGHVMINIVQKDAREDRRNDGKYKSMGMYVMKVEDNRCHRIHQSQEMISTLDHTAARSILLRLTDLKRGRYLVLPTLNQPKIECDFQIRFYAHSDISAEHLDCDLPTEGRIRFLGGKQPVAVTRINIISAREIVVPEETNEAMRVAKQVGGTHTNPYCIVECEGQKERTITRKKTNEPEFDASFMFFQRNPDKPIVVSVLAVYNYNAVKDTFLGQVSVPCTLNGKMEKHTMALMPKKDPDADPLPGFVTVELATYGDPLYL